MASGFSPNVVKTINHLSESVLKGMCDLVGTQDRVAIRRTIFDIFESAYGQGVLKIHGYPISVILSGSRREGFLFKQSDLDMMCPMEPFKVVWNKNQLRLDKIQLMFDSSASPPGYGLLESPTYSLFRLFVSGQIGIFLDKMVVFNGGKYYISSSKTRQVVCSVLPFYDKHGPCATGCFDYLEVDNAWCIKSDFWPPLACGFKNRCTMWPNTHVLNDIITQGCHLVAIGHKLGRHEEHEWRISFSVAEQKLVYSMNHSEFLLYGLLKIFLKEVINNVPDEEDKLLCSYHMKTAVFWVLQQSTLPECCPQNFLQYFWACLKLILKWVYEGVCPNFFIPENNMFVANIYGSAQKRLFDKLHQIYEKGILCLLECPSIYAYMLPTLTKELHKNNPDECQLMRKLFLELEFYDVITMVCFINYFEPLKIVEYLAELSLTPIQSLLVQRLTVNCYKHTVFLLLSVIPVTRKTEYAIHKMICRALELSLKFGDVSDLLFQAMYYYNTVRYEEALSILNTAKDMLEKPYMMHKGHFDRKLHDEAVKGHSYSEVARKTFVSTVTLLNSVPYICELELERVKCDQYPFGVLQIPPMVLLHMLEFLCYRHVDMEKAMAAFNDLFVLVHSDQGKFITPSCRDISWQILGICQQLIGRFVDALESFSEAYKQAPVNKLRYVSRLRMYFLRCKLGDTTAEFPV